MFAAGLALGGTQGVVLDGPLLLAAMIAVMAGTLSFFSPCCLPLVPGYLSYVTGLAGEDLLAPAGSTRMRRRTVWGAVLFVAGFAAVFTSYGLLFGSFGALLIDRQATLIRVLGAVTIVVGLVFTGVLWHIPLAGRTFKPGYRPQAGLAGAPVVGVLFGLGWTPCIGPTLAAVLTLATSTADAGRGAALSFAYSAGLGIPFIAAAFSVQRFIGSVAWARRHAAAIMRSGGSMLIVLGVLQISGLWTRLIASMQGWITGWTLPL